MGRGRGRQVVAVAKTADVIIIMSEWSDSETLFPLQCGERKTELIVGGLGWV